MARLLVLGDSITWGQGLDEAHKASTLLAEAWRADAGGTELDVRRFAHSGADIWDDGQSGAKAVLDLDPAPFPTVFAVGEGEVLRTRACGDVERRNADGEIPDEEPYLLRQILDAKSELGDERVDLVLVDAGINDTEVYNLVLPFKDRDSVVARGRSVEARVTFALARIRESFPDAKVIITGYYPVVSDQTRILELLQFTRVVVEAAVAEGVRVADDLRQVLVASLESELGIEAHTTPSMMFKPHALLSPVHALARRSTEWTAAVHGALESSVASFNADGGRAAFVDPRFGPEHAVFASESLLWPFSNGKPQDPQADARSTWCDANGVVGFSRLVVELASMGHPNPLGARRYAEGIIAAAKGLGCFGAR